jgi:hypothetical protein
VTCKARRETHRNLASIDGFRFVQCKLLHSTHPTVLNMALVLKQSYWFSMVFLLENRNQAYVVSCEVEAGISYDNRAYAAPADALVSLYRSVKAKPDLPPFPASPAGFLKKPDIVVAIVRAG